MRVRWLAVGVAAVAASFSLSTGGAGAQTGSQLPTTTIAGGGGGTTTTVAVTTTVGGVTTTTPGEVTTTTAGEVTTTTAVEIAPQVLGNVTERPAAVLGNEVSRAEVAGGGLAVTGADIVAMVGLALALVAFGAVLVRRSRARSSTR